MKFIFSAVVIFCMTIDSFGQNRSISNDCVNGLQFSNWLKEHNILEGQLLNSHGATIRYVFFRDTNLKNLATRFIVDGVWKIRLEKNSLQMKITSKTDTYLVTGPEIIFDTW